ncbi:palmitoyltransferase AKR1-like isoform X2 [Haliotis rufescens]|uniref:palmitoyltransferase AKR1-like isoform X2 n=1 Tax=Haliotis rufescens TaxID=6454 RepID=UPI00201EDBD0|nr:palmitoyltransferase AKR1-like isoform X2 [Haliotis rufescens]
METVSTVIVIGLVSFCGVSVVHADTSLTAFNGRLNLLEGDINALNQTAVNLETKTNYKFSTLESSLKESLTNTFIPALIKGLVKQAITDILKEGYNEDMISSLTQDIHSLQLQLNETVTGLRDAKMVNTVLRQDLMTLNTSCVKMSQSIERLTNNKQSCREGLRGMQQKLRTDIQSLNNQLNQTIDDLHDSKQRITGLTEDMMALNTSCVMREGFEENDVNETSLSTSSLTQVPSTTSPPMFPGAAGASNDPSQGERAAQMTTVTTHATPSPTECEDLYDASEAGSLEEVKRILSLGVDVNCRWGEWSMTPVMRAAYRGHRDVVELLVSEGADVSLVDRDGDNTLHFACRGGHLDTVKFVLSLNAVDIDARDNSGETAADWARYWGYSRVADLLVSRGAQ